MSLVRSRLDYRPLLIAHRGDSADYPENTRSAFQAAIRAGVDAIELDVRLSADQKTVICHDANLYRFGGPRTSVRKLTLVAMQKIDIGSWRGKECRGQYVMTLDDALMLCKKVVVCIELKASAGKGASLYHRRLVSAVIKVIRAQKAEKRVQLLCFNANVLQSCAQYAPNVPRVRNCERLPQNVDRWLVNQQGCYAVCFDQRLVTVTLVAAAQERGLRVYSYTANTKSVVDQLLRCGVDGILSDRPAWLVQAVRKR